MKVKALANLNALIIVLSIFSGSLAQAAWRENSFAGINFDFENLDADYKIERLRIDSSPTRPEFRIELEVETSHLQELLQFLTDLGYSHSLTGETLIGDSVINISVPMTQPDRVKSLIDSLNEYEPIEPQEILIQMKRRVDSEAARLERRPTPPLQLREDTTEYRRIFGMEDIFRSWAGEVIHEFPPSPAPVNPARPEPRGLNTTGIQALQNIRYSDFFGPAMYLPTGVAREFRSAPLPVISQAQRLKPSQFQILQKDKLSSEEQAAQCSVCLTEIKDAFIPVKVNCGGGHMFCQACIEEAYRHQQTCPNCRQPIEERSSKVQTAWHGSFELSPEEGEIIAQFSAEERAQYERLLRNPIGIAPIRRFLSEVAERMRLNLRSIYELPHWGGPAARAEAASEPRSFELSVEETQYLEQLPAHMRHRLDQMTPEFRQSFLRIMFEDLRREREERQ